MIKRHTGLHRLHSQQIRSRIIEARSNRRDVLAPPAGPGTSDQANRDGRRGGRETPWSRSRHGSDVSFALSPFPTSLEDN